MTRQTNAGGTAAISSLWNYGENNIDIDGNESYYLGITTNQIPITISESRLVCNSERLEISIYEDVSWTGGSPFSLFNKNRLTSVTPNFSLQANVNPISLGPAEPVSRTTLRARAIDDDGESFDFNSIQGDNIDNKWVFKANSEYVIRFRNRTSRNNRKLDAVIVFDELLYAKED